MAISTSNLGSGVNTENTPTNSNAKTVGNRNDAYTETDELSIETLKENQNRAIVEAQQQVNLGSKNEPLALVLKAALEAINERLNSTFGENAIETSVEKGVDVSPEATAERIVSQSTAFFESFRQQEQNASLSFEEQVDKFLDVIGGGIDNGFAEARDILESLSVLSEEIAANIDKTYVLVQTGLEDFRESIDSQAPNE